jgi:hypothetical protein
MYIFRPSVQVPLSQSDDMVSALGIPSKQAWPVPGPYMGRISPESVYGDPDPLEVLPMTSYNSMSLSSCLAI